MSITASERSWLFNPDLLKLVHQCRRLIQSEFGVKLHLTEDHLERRLAEYAGKTRSSHLVRTWEALKPKIPNLELEMPEPEGAPNPAVPAKPKRMYRGQAIADDEVTTEPRADKKIRIYRGQIVE